MRRLKSSYFEDEIQLLHVQVDLQVVAVVLELRQWGREVEHELTGWGDANTCPGLQG